MILVTVGMHTDGFLRLIEEMDRIASTIEEEVIMQIGATRYKPRTASYFDFTTLNHMEELCKRARIIVSHAGAGSILTALKYGRPLVVVPRLQKYDEHMDDHQLELAEVLSQAGVLLVAYETLELVEKLRQADNLKPWIPKRTDLVRAIRKEVLAVLDAKS